MIKYYEMTHKDIDEVSKMYVECFNAEPWNDKWTEEIAAKRLLKMLSYDGAYGIVCREDGNVLGMILGDVYKRQALLLHMLIIIYLKYLLFLIL